MPSPESITQVLRAIATEWAILAMLWHVYFGGLGVALAAGWRPERRDLGLYLVLPLISVSVLAWLHWNPFNGTAIAGFGFVLLVASMLLGREPVTPGPAWSVTAGILLFAFGWSYPHLLGTESWVPYLYKAPTGLVPCPTLAIITGVSLVFGAFQSRAWAWVLGIAGLFYGLVGALYLNVALDWTLAAGAVVLLLAGHAAGDRFTDRPDHRRTERVEPTLGGRH